MALVITSMNSPRCRDIFDLIFIAYLELTVVMLLKKNLFLYLAVLVNTWQIRDLTYYYAFRAVG